MINFKRLKNKKVVVMGLGLLGGGVETVRWLVKKGANVLVTDLKPKRELKESLEKLKGLPIKYVLEKHREEDFKNVDLIIKNPGVQKESKLAASGDIVLLSPGCASFGIFQNAYDRAIQFIKAVKNL